MAKASDLVLWFSEVDKRDIPLVGGKGANLGEMTKAGFPVPNGFIVTANAYYKFLNENNLPTKIKHLLNTANYEKADSLVQVSTHIKKYIIDGEVSEELSTEVFRAYRRLSGVMRDALVAVRSSATAEDLPNASFAGQQETFLNIKGEANLLIAIKKAWASLFDARAIFYRNENHFNHFKIGIAIPVEKMVASEKSGIMFTLDPITNDKTKIVIEAIYGLGEYIVQGKVTPDHYEVSKKDMSIINKEVVDQKILLKKISDRTKEASVSRLIAKKQKISNNQILELALLAKKLENHYYFPQDIEWAIEKNKIYIVQTRPVTTISNKKGESQSQNEMEEKNLEILVKGDPASPGIASGPAKIISSAKEINKVLPGDVLVTTQTNPDFVPAMKKAVAIVTNSGGRTSHAAIVSRELGIPAVVGAENATKILKTGMVVTVNGVKGEVYKGGHIQLSNPKAQISNIEHIKTATKVYVNLAQPDLAGRISQRNVDGVGLLRAEFMMAGIGTHPKKLIKDGKKEVFVGKLADGIESFTKSFYPRPVIYRTSDFKTNEYRELVGGKDYEPVEPNPMLGYRGVYRYLHDPKVFEMEIEAIKLVRNKRGFKNLWVMLPFVRTVNELIEVKRILSSHGLTRSSNFKLWMMVEIPSNVILLEKFIETGIDGVSIGSNDLTMLILGTDRDNSEVAHEFSEKNEAVLWALEHVIKTAHKYGITSSICGQAPSQSPEIIEYLIKWGITSVSVSPDAIDSARELISKTEKKILSNHG